MVDLATVLVGTVVDYRGLLDGPPPPLGDGDGGGGGVAGTVQPGAGGGGAEVEADLLPVVRGLGGERMGLAVHLGVAVVGVLGVAGSVARGLVVVLGITGLTVTVTRLAELLLDVLVLTPRVRVAEGPLAAEPRLGGHHTLLVVLTSSYWATCLAVLVEGVQVGDVCGALLLGHLGVLRDVRVVGGGVGGVGGVLRV